MKPLRLAVIGAGMGFEPHAKSLLELSSDIDVAAVVARSPDARNAVQARYGFAVVASAEEIWPDPSIEAVLILTPPSSHLELVRAAATAGKHVLLEKPLDISLDRARALVELCEDQGVLLGTVLQHRYRQSSRALYDALARDALGTLVSVSVQIPWWRPQSYYDVPGRGTLARDGGGVLLTQAIHTIDLALSLAGPLKSVFAYAVTSLAHTMETEDLVAAALRFDNGAIGTLHATTACYPGFAEQIRLVGTKGSATLEGDALQMRFLDGSAIEIGTPAVLGGGADPMAFSHATHCDLLRGFIHAVRTQTSPRPDGRDALRVQTVLKRCCNHRVMASPSRYRNRMQRRGPWHLFKDDHDPR